jgi:hypothetical protein
MSLSPPETTLDHISRAAFLTGDHCPLAFVLVASVSIACWPDCPHQRHDVVAAAIARGAAIDSLAPATGASLVGLPVDGMGWRMVGRRKPGVDWPLLLTGVAVTLALIAYATFHLAGVRFF